MANIASLNVAIGADTRDFNLKIPQVSSKLKGLQKETTSLGGSFTKMGGLITAALGAAAIAAAGALARKIFDVRSEFQKYEAVLKTALGSTEAMQIAMSMIKDVAASTNFSVAELTEAYVKFANRGLRLTKDEIISLADVANSTGKSFDQLTEAVLDSMTGENERLKEFGIIAKKTGETTQFTFKGVTTEVENTSESITNYLIGLGKLEGVTGSTAAISKTLSGQMSNLGDAADSLFNTLGQQGEGVLNILISRFGEFLRLLELSLKTTAQIKLEEQIKAMGHAAEESVKQFTSFLKRSQELTGATFNLEQATSGYINRLKESIEIAKQREGAESINVKLLQEELRAIETYLTAQKKQIDARKEATKEAEKETGILNQLNEQKKIEQDLMNAATNEAEIERRLQNIALIDKEIKRLQDLNKARSVDVNPIQSRGFDGAGVSPETEIDFSPLMAQADAYIEKMEEVDVKTSETAQFMASYFAGAAISVAESFGTMIAGGSSIGNFFDGIILMVVDFASQFGKLLISSAIASAAFQEALMSNPYLALAAGVALVAAAAAAKSLLKKGPMRDTPALAHGGLAFGPTLALVGDNRGAQSDPEVIAPLSKLKEMLGTNNGFVDVRVTGKIRGRDMEIVQEKTDLGNKRIGRN
jgi:hypothetical protein